MEFQYSEEALTYLKKQDEHLAKLIDEYGYIKREINPDLFSSIIFHIIGQQISLKAQKTIIKRLEDKIGEINFDNMLKTSEKTLKDSGISNRKISYINDFLNRLKDRSLNLDTLKDLSNEDIIKTLTRVKGIGVWTAEMILIFSLNRKDILSYNDFGIKKGLTLLYHYDFIDKKLFNEISKRYHPYESIASFYLWQLANNS